MVIGLQIGKGNSIGVPGKNIRKLLGRPIMEYPLIAASQSSLIDEIFISTDSLEIAMIAKKYNAIHIDRPSFLAKPDTLTEDVLIHALKSIESNIGKEPELICIMFCNVATTTTSNLERAIKILRDDKNKELDSVFSVAEFNMFSPMRARKIKKNSIIEPYVKMEYFGGGVSSIRDDNEDCFFADFGIQVCRPRCIENIDTGMPPVKWMGRRSYALKTDYGFDIDKEWQFSAIEAWLKQNGFKK